MFSVPSSLQVGRPEAAPEPAAAATPFSTVPDADFVPVEVAPLEPAPPDLPPRKSERKPRLVVLLAAAVAVLAPMKVEIAAAASTGPPPPVRPRALALLVPSSFARITEVSASEPQPGEAQSRGVPSITYSKLGYGMEESQEGWKYTGKAWHDYTVSTLDFGKHAVCGGLR